MTNRSRLFTLAFTLSTIVAAVLCGCGEAGPATSVQGKVTLNGEPVAGSIHFVSADGKEATSPIGPSGGTYSVADPPVGEVTVLFKGGPLTTTPPTAVPGATAMPGGTDKMASKNVAPPAKYADAANGIKFTVAAGHNQKDFELTP